jgi:lysozyme
MNRVTAAAIELIKRFEGFRASPYRDVAGVKTVGYGHALLPGEHFTAISEDEADALLKQDIAIAGQRVLNHIFAPLTDNQFSALVSLVFNLGVTPLKGTLGARLNEGLYAQAAAQFDRWVYADGRKLDGLARRRAAERALFEKDTA